MGEKALLVEVESNAVVHDLAAYARAVLGRDIQEIVPGHDTLLLVGRKHRPDHRFFAEWEQGTHQPTSGVRHLIPVTYNGADLLSIADECSMSVGEVTQRHQAATYNVAFCGFAPGFAYLIGGDPALRPSRLESPRPRVPAGSVAIAGEYSAVYPAESPGGWRLLGLSRVTLFDPLRTPPILLSPGDVVEFQAARP